MNSNLIDYLNQFLLKLSKKYKVDLSYFAKGSFWLGIGQIGGVLSSFLLAIVFANRLSQEVYGQYTYLISLVGLFNIFALPGVNTALTQAVARNFEKTFYTGFKTKIRWSLLGSAASLILALYYWYFRDNPTIATALFIAGFTFPLIYSPLLYLEFLDGRKLFKIKTLYNLMSQFIFALVLIISLFLTSDLIIIFSVFLFSQIIVNLYFYQKIKHIYKPNHKNDPATISYGFNLSIMQVISIISSYLDRFLVFYFLGPINLAIYTMAINPAMKLNGAFHSLSFLILPKFAQKNMAEININLYKRIFQLGLIGVFTAIFYFIFTPLIYQVFFPQYLSSINFARIFSVTLILGGISPFIGAIFRAQKLTKQMYILGFSTQLLLMVSIFTLGNIYGINGILFSKIIVPFFSLILALILWKKASKKV